MAGGGMLEALLALLRGDEASVDDRAATARAGAEDASQMLPEQVMPRKALGSERARYAEIDALSTDDIPEALRMAAERRRLQAEGGNGRRK